MLKKGDGHKIVAIKKSVERGVDGSPQTNGLPPEASNTKPDENVDDGDDESVTPPLRQRNIVCAVEDRGRADTVVGETSHQVGEE